MKIAIIYSSLTGNTKMVAEAIAAVLPGSELYSVEDQVDLTKYDCIAVGFWVDRGTADAKAAACLKQLNYKKVALFATLGADPKSEHAEQSLANAAAILADSNKLLGTFICQGKVDPKLIAKMAKMFPAGHPHGMNEERRARHEAASTHPDAADLKAAQEKFLALMGNGAKAGDEV